MAKKKYTFGTPDYFDIYVNGKASGPTPDLFKQYSGSSLSKYFDDTQAETSTDDSEDEQKKRLKKEIENLKKRAKDAGLNPDPDKRNALEKALNLKQDQGLIGDTFELMMRPLNGVANAQKQNVDRNKDLKKAVKDGKITEDQYYKELNKRDKESLKKLPSDFMDGLKGKKEVTSADVLESAGMKKGWKRTVAGLGLDIAQDPMNLVGGVIGKGVGLGLKGAGKGASKLLDVADPNKVLKNGTAEVVDTLKSAFANTAPKSVKNLKQSIEAKKSMLQERSLGILNNMLKQPDAMKLGEDAAIRMEANLTQAPEVNDIVQRIVDGSNHDAMRLRGGETTKVHTNANGIKGIADVGVVGKDVENLVQGMNQQIHNSDKFLQSKAKVEKSQANHTAKIGEVAAKYGSVDEANGMFDELHNLLDDAKTQYENRLRLSGHSDDEIMDIMDEIGMNFHDDIARATFKSLNPILNKYDKDILNIAGIDKPMLKEMGQDYWNLQNSMTKAAKAKQKGINMLNPVRVNELAGGEAGTGFQITKTNGTQVAKGLKDRETLTKNFIVNTIKDPVEKAKALENWDKQTITLEKIHRDMSEMGPESQAIADTLTKMQDDIVAWGKSEGVEIPQIEGYMRHAITKEYQQLTQKNIMSGKGKQYGGNKKVINPRDLYGSAQDVNEMMGKNVFESNAYKAMVNAHTKVTNYIATESFLNKVLSNPSVAVKADKTLDVAKYYDEATGKLKRGYQELKIDDFKFYKALDEDAKTILAARPSESFIVDSGTVELLKNYDDLVGQNSIMQKLLQYTIDPATRLWKGITLMSAGYHVRNLIGNGFNRHLAGMTVDQQSKYDGKAAQLLWAYNKKVLPKIAKGETLDPKLKTVQKQVEEFYSSGLRDSSKVRNEMGVFDKRYEKLDAKLQAKTGGEVTKDSAVTKVTKVATAVPKALMGANYKIANSADDMQRFSMFMWAKSKNMPNPVDTVKGAMFDYSDLTQTEKALFKRIMPFYTFARKNLPYQVQNLIQQPQQYNNLNKVLNASYDLTGQDKENMPDYLKKSMAIGSPLGKNEVLKAYLPASDLMNFLDSPTNASSQALSMIAPAIKLLPEEVTNTDFFRQQAIEKFDGEKSESYGGVTPKWAYAFDQLGGKNVDRAIKALTGLGKKDTGNFATDNLASLFTTYDPNQVENSKLYDKRKELQDQQKTYEQDTGKKYRTTAEIKKGSYFGF